VLSIRTRAAAAAAQLTPPVRRILMHSLIFGLAMSIADLLFNFYLVSLGYGTDMAGFLSTIYRFAGVVAGVPIGMLIDRAGPQRAIQVGATIFALGWAGQLMITEVWALAITQAIIGAAGLLTLTSVVPLLTGITTNEQRASIFGLNAGAALVIGLVGGTVGGVLPALGATLLNVGPQTTEAYRLALGIVVVMALLALLPLIQRITLDAVSAPRRQAAGAGQPSDRLPLSYLFRMTLPSLTLGIGAGVFLPFQNLFFRQQFQLSDALVGTILACGALAMGLGAMLGAPVAKRMGVKQAAAWTRLGAVPCMLLMLSPVLWISTIGFLIRGWFIGASFPLNDAYAMQITSPRHRGTLVSVTSMLWSLGWAITSSVAGWVESQYGFTPLIMVAAVAYVFSGLAIFWLPSEQP
jgi:MFS family permease